jgi:Protein of unknown function (DUF1570)
VFTRQVAPYWQKGDYERPQLLDGTAKRSISKTPNPQDFARLMTLALLERALDDEGERAAVTHEGTRQLLVATGVAPRTVDMPQWVEFGAASVFETPKGPFPGAPLESSIALFPGVAAPSWAYLRPFKDMLKKLEARPQGFNPADLLRAVVTDREFNQVISSADLHSLFQARTTGWALSYYLFKTRLPAMLKFYKELAKLPRYLEIDDREILACFARAFDVANDTGTGPDPVKFENLAKDWVSYIRNLPVPGAELGLERELTPGQGTTPQGGPPGAPQGGPTRPGPGRPGPGGPG